MLMNHKRQASEQGMVSILISIIMMIVISLIILGITQVTRSNQRELLDQQLSSQAYYAAESGLNQAVKFFSTNATTKIDTLSSGSCNSFITAASPNGLGLTNGVLDSNTSTSYTCLMVDSTPPSLQKAPLTQDANTVWHVQDATAGQNFSQFEFKWKPNTNTQFTGGSNTCPAAANSPSNFTQWGNWNCAFGILRVDLVDMHGTVNGPASLEGYGLQKSLYLVPTFQASGVTTPQGWPGGTAGVIYVKCSATLCDLKLNTPGNSGDYFSRMIMIYQDSDSVTLTGTDGGGATTATFANGQAVIDVTGKAQDELRRVQARIPLTVSTSPVPYYALQTTDNLCKLLTVGPTATATDGC